MLQPPWVMPEEYVLLLAALLMIALAVWVFLYDLGNRLNQALALLVFVRGLMNLGTALNPIGVPGPWVSVDGYGSIAMPFVLLFFAYHYRLANGTGRRRPWAPWALLGAAMLAEGLYLVDHRWYDQWGGLGLMFAAYIALYAIIAWIIARDAFELPRGSRRSSFLLVSAGLVLLSAYYSVLTLGESALRPPPLSSLVAWTEIVLMAVTAAITVRLLVALARRSRGGPDRVGQQEVRFLRWLVFAMGLAAGTVVLRLWSPEAASTTARLFDGVWTLAFPVLVSFAILRFRLFGLDLRVRKTISRGTIVGAFLAVFFIATELTQEILSERQGPWMGALAAGLLLFALHPLQRYAERLGAHALPHAKPVDGMSHTERVGLYRDWLEAAWADGVLSLKDRELLDIARRRLRLEVSEAAALEHEIVATARPRLARTAPRNETADPSAVRH